MANNDSNESFNKILIIDPNRPDESIIDKNNSYNLSGQDIATNIFKQNEELNIYVQLTATIKGRTVLTANASGNSTETTKEFKITLINGEDIDGKKSLTTNYTLLTTSFDKGREVDENLGMTDIQIEFDTAYMPLITINFVDIRGSAIFQNDYNIRKGKSNYGIFFNLPYPIFELTVKGYYGVPLKYCLHMTSFTSRFNSESGNFEISCKFRGYTYAMLADMLIGYLKVIEFTDKGKNIYNEIKDETGDISTISELRTQILDLNTRIKKLSQKNPSSEILNVIPAKTQLLENIKNEIILLGDKLDPISPSTAQSGPTTNDKFNYYKIIISAAFNANPNYDAAKTNYNNNIKTYIEQFNGEDGEFNINLALANFQLDSGIQLNTTNLLQIDRLSEENQELVNLIEKRGYQANSLLFQYYDMRKVIKLIDDAKNNLKLLNTQQTLNITNEIDKITTKDVGLNTTIFNITKIFTTAIDVFVRAVHRVSVEAENIELSPDRNRLLKKIFNGKKTNDYIDNDTTYYAWPKYNEKQTDGKGYVEKYLGLADGIKGNENRIPELVFVEDLIKAFIEERKKEIAEEIELSNTEKHWIPVNPSDTRLFGIDTSPYRRIQNQYDIETLKTLILTRAMTFLGYSNSSLTEEQIKEMSRVETESLLEIDDKTLILAISNLTVDAIIKETNGIFGFKQPILTDNNNGEYEYTFLKYPNKSPIILPIQIDFNPNETQYTKWPNPYVQTDIIFKTLVDKSETNVFLTNYNSKVYPKGLDGGVYVKIFNVDEFPNPQELKSTVNTTSLILLSELEKDSNSFNAESAGFNPFGGSYGIQEFSQMNYGDIGEGELKYVFYRDNNFNALANYRDNKKTEFDLGNHNVKILTDFDTYNDWNNINPIKEIYNEKNFSKTRELFIKPINNVTYPFIEQTVRINDTDAFFRTIGNKYITFSLLGSSFYYSQEDSTNYRKIVGNYTKALLFLNTIPMYSLIQGTNIGGVSFDEIKVFDNQIINLFNKNAGFIHAPKLWCAYIGGLLWRNDESIYKLDNNFKIIGGGSGTIDPINWDELYPTSVSTLQRLKPKRDEYINVILLNTWSPNISKFTFKNKIDDFVLGLPEQVKIEFKNIFFEFVNNGDWNNIKNSLEIHNGDSNSFNLKIFTLTTNNKTEVSVSTIKNNFINLDNYSDFLIHKPNTFWGNHYQIDLALKDNSVIVNKIINLMKEEVVIANNSYKIWEETSSNQPNRANISTSKDKLELYIKTMLDLLKPKQTEILQENNTILKKIFNTDNLDAIKLNIYKYCKNINDKWLAGNSDENNIIYSCNNNQKHKYLIDSFRFVSRSFVDIGKEFYTNPKNIPDMLKNESNISFYNFYSTYLTDHNFDFIPLPAFINYKDEKVFKEQVFATYPEYVTSTKIQAMTGPSFVCVYSAGKSSALDLGDNGDYSNDGFDFKIGEIPEDFTQSDGLAVFKVNYGQQNQNIFKNLELDQSEFKETEESLQLTSDMVDKKSENDRSLMGQNLYNVYNVRSYSAKVEMLGNPMIQPMMYFQLNNIPMFHGAYLITKVNHNIKPNHMTTTFTGQRISYSQLPLIKQSDIYVSMANSLGYTLDPNIASNIVVSQGSLPSTNLNFVPPVQAKYKIRRAVNLHSSNGDIHKGVDLSKIPVGTKIYAIEKGTIELIKIQTDSKTGDSIGYGLHIIINHGQLGDGRYYKSLYGHLSDIDSGIVSNVNNQNLPQNIYNSIISGYNIGTSITKNQLIGLSGGDKNSNDTLGGRGQYNLAGTSSGSHLHFEIRSSDKPNFGFFDSTTTIVDPVGAIPLSDGQSYFTNPSSNQRIASQLIYEGLKQQLGYPDEAIAGIMGNLYQESRFFATARNKSDAGFGLAQWTGQRNNDIMTWMKSNNLNSNDYINQIKYLNYELTKQWVYTGNNLKNNKSVAPTSANDVSDATTIFYVTYEGGNLGINGFTTDSVTQRLNTLRNAESKKDSYPKRIKFAKAFLQMIKNKNFSYPE